MITGLQKRFNLFLASTNIRGKYITNLLIEDIYYPFKNLAEMFQTFPDPEDWIINAFDFTKTTEGHEYWTTKANQWRYIHTYQQ